METYYGLVRVPADCIKLFEACRIGLLPRVQRRLSEKERQSIRAGSVYVWDEREAGMRRWTDGKSWSASRVSGSFLTYREMEGKRGNGLGGSTRRTNGKTPDSGRGSDEDQDDGEPDGYRYKPDGLMKQSFSITTSAGQHLHLISYYSRPQHGQPEFLQPTNDPSLRNVVPPKNMYPESSMNESLLPATTKTPLQSTGYAPQHLAPPPPLAALGPYHSHYAQHGYSWPPSPIATPPYSHGHYTTAAPYPPQSHPPPGPPYGPPPPPPPPPQPYHARSPSNHPPHPAYDRPSLPPPQLSAALPASAVTLPPPYQQSLSQPRARAIHSPSQHPQAPARETVIIDPALGRGPGDRDLSGLLPPLGSVAHHAAATPSPRRRSASPTRSFLSEPSSTNGANEGIPAVGSKVSLSAILLHPNPIHVRSESASTTPGSSTNASSSPRSLARAAAALSCAPAPPRVPVATEDARALGALNKQFCI